jgi:thymidylate synthase
MKLTTIEAKTLPEAWFLCVQRLYAGFQFFGLSTDGLHTFGDGTHIYTIDRGSFAGQRRLEFDCITVHIEFPGSRPLVPDVPPGVPAPSTMEYVEQYLPYLMTSSRKDNEEYTYGMYLEPQIESVIKMYRRDGFGTNQAYMAIGDSDSIKLPNPPCLRGIDTRIQDGKLHFVVYFRSWDLWAGFPSNLAAIQLLKEYMASEIGVLDGEIIACSKGLHLYEYSWTSAKAVVNR